MPHLVQLSSRPQRTEFNKHCPVCLSRFFDPRTLPCHHTYCVDCLQFVIDLNQRGPDGCRGFHCLVCRYFTKVLDYSIPRSNWAQELPWHFRTYGKQHDDPENESGELADPNGITPRNNATKRKSRYEWVLDWRVSGFPMSFAASPGKCVQWRFLKHTGCFSKIQAATFYKDSFIVFDKGVSEIIVYNTADCKLKYSMYQADIYDIAIQGSVLYMTNPEGRIIHTLNVDSGQKLDNIKLTASCYGIGALENVMAVILCNNNNNRYHISFLERNYIKEGATISLDSGALEFKSPRRLAVCKLTSLLYVGDIETGVIKCYDATGCMQWETNVYDASGLATWYDPDAHTSRRSCLIIARKYTNSLDVLSRMARFDGRLESKTYGLDGPHVICVNETSGEILVVDDSQMMHVFKLRNKYRRTADKTPVSCVCSIS